MQRRAAHISSDEPPTASDPGPTDTAPEDPSEDDSGTDGREPVAPVIENEVWAEPEGMSATLSEWFSTTVALDESSARPANALPEPLFQPRWERNIVVAAIANRVAAGEIDVERLVELAASGRPVDRVPRRERTTLSRGVQLIIDNGEKMAPFRSDVREVVGLVERLLPASAIEIVHSASIPPRAAREPSGAYRLPPARTPIVIFSNFGVASAMDAFQPLPAEFRSFNRRLCDRHCPLIVFAPTDPALLPNELRVAAAIIPWDRRTVVATVQRVRALAERRRIR